MIFNKEVFVTLLNFEKDVSRTHLNGGTEMKRVIPLIYISVCLLFVGFQVSAAGQDEAPASATEPMTISWFGLFGENIEDGNDVQVHLEQMFNVKLVNKQLDHTDTEKMSLMVASGELPDALYCSFGARNYYMRGAFRSISKDMIVAYVPSLAKYLDSMGPMAWNYALVPGETDQYMGLARSYEYKEGVTYMPFMRLDWLEKLDMVPDGLQHVGAGPSEGKSFWTKEPYTFEEFEDILYAFRDSDLDGNGKNDTIPFTGTGDFGNKGLANLLNLFGFRDVANYNDNGQTVKMAIHSQFKEALKLGQKWFQDGILDNELPNVSKKVREEKFASGIAGAYSNAHVYISYGGNALSSNYNPQLLYARDPDAKVVMVPIPLGMDGQQYANCVTGTLPLDGEHIFVAEADVSDEKLERILQIVEYTSWHPEGRVYSTFGWPGKHFDWSGEPWKSYAQFKEDFEYGGATGIRFYTYDNWYGELHNTFAVTPEARPLMDFFTYGAGAEAAQPAYREDIFATTKYSEIWAQFYGALNTIRDEFAWRAITTDMDIDAEWDAYVAKWLKSGGKDILTEVEKMPIVNELRKGNVVY